MRLRADLNAVIEKIPVPARSATPGRIWNSWATLSF